jgi:hypothetical protein
MMLDSMTLLDIHDAVVCGSCGQLNWEPDTSETCARCDSHERANACSLFLLNDFTAITSAFEESFNR